MRAEVAAGKEDKEKTRMLHTEKERKAPKTQNCSGGHKEMDF